MCLDWRLQCFCERLGRALPLRLMRAWRMHLRGCALKLQCARWLHGRLQYICGGHAIETDRGERAMISEAFPMGGYKRRAFEFIQFFRYIHLSQFVQLISSNHSRSCLFTFTHTDVAEGRLGLTDGNFAFVRWRWQRLARAERNSAP